MKAKAKVDIRTYVNNQTQLDKRSSTDGELLSFDANDCSGDDLYLKRYNIIPKRI